MGLTLFKTRLQRPRIAVGGFVSVQVIALVSLPVWFFFWMLFNAGKSVAERNVSLYIHFLFGTQWQVPLFLLLGSVVMWLSVFSRLKRVALVAAIAVCMPLASFIVILILQYRDAYY